jgi:broad specificity phosphatase PhoE
MRCRAVLQWGMAGSRIILVRHGQTAWSRSGRHTGRTDVPLEPEGVAQAEALGGLLFGRPFALVLTSPLERAAETCRLAGFGDRAEDCPDLVEWDYGAYEGQTTEEIRQEHPGWSLWTDGVPGGETAADVGRRADRVVARAGTAEGDTLCFAHGHFLRVLAARWTGLPPAGARLLALAAGSLSVLGWERETPVIVRWNELPASPLPAG